MSSKHLSNDITALVQASLRSATLLNPQVGFDSENKTVYLRSASSSDNVAIVSGGGSGHEPAYAAFVGHGLLSGAVAGSIFASPSADQVFQCLMRLGAEKPGRGILVIIMNYTGDALHFGMAIEKARARGLKAQLLIVGDDVGVGRAKSGRVGRRGLAGTVLVQKIAGALAARGAAIEKVFEMASLVASNVATVGASLSHVHVPGRVASKDELDGNDEIEIGMGIHNEEGFGRVKTDLQGLISMLLKQLLDTSDKDRGFIEIKSGEPAVLMINNLGGLSQLELGAVTTEVYKQLGDNYGIIPKRVLAGTYMSSLNGLGFSVTLLKLVNKDFVELLDDKAEATGWIPPAPPASWKLQGSSGNDQTEKLDFSEKDTPSNLTVKQADVQKYLTIGLKNLIEAEPEVTKYDTLVGDGDCGLCLKVGAEAVLSYVQSQPTTDAVQLVSQLAHVIEKSMDGTSGALYAIFINALATKLREADREAQPTQATPVIWAKALQGAMEALGRYTPARPGDRTVVDALAPFIEAFTSSGDISTAVQAARKGCENTKGMEASLGRSVYVGGDEWKNCPDPGAFGLVKFLEGFVGV
ncbi:putative dihydroxyacetone kinase protein [Phaeoacremonium minimum UCRPA7]|uniref:Putative dihydroxyacetone kinase protein n=1 Tax=Phaeoacremonium minimum (strain UCR-PA7) TaxID=1286976 RepID=R8BVL6_PHAM7|nr:putative dihydroxyacetone kinase protein [Phaeoacremonium minimum UCRPA7]EOO03350.1 putative dihydroxyacetone kinase protein [Phaeoacremonium minimum UCRPA7]